VPYRHRPSQATDFPKGSKWPLIDRNSQTFVPNIFEAKESDFRAATHRVYRSSRYPSRVTVPVVVRPFS